MKKKNGFSLIDVLIAMAILGFMLLSIAQLVIVALNGENNARHYTTLLYYGQQQLETLLHLPAADARLSAYNIIPDLQVAEGCDQVTDRNSFCFNYANIDANHKVFPASSYFFMAWSVEEISIGGPKAITLYVVPNPPPQGGFRSPVILTGIAMP